MRAIALTTWFQLVLTIGLTSFGQLFLKLAANQPGFQDAMTRGPKALLLAAPTEPRLIVGVLLYGLSTVSWVLVLTRLDLSQAYPVVMMSFVVILVLSWAALGETIGPVRLFGAALVIVGVCCIARSESG